MIKKITTYFFFVVCFKFECSYKRNYLPNACGQYSHNHYLSSPVNHPTNIIQQTFQLQNPTKHCDKTDNFYLDLEIKIKIKRSTTITKLQLIKCLYQKKK